MTITNKSSIRFRFITLCSLIMTLSIVNSNPVAAQRISPRQAKMMGTVITTAIGYYVDGYFKEMGAKAARNQIQSGQTYTTYYYVQMSDGYYYKVCQNYRNNRAISEPYWCQ